MNIVETTFVKHLSLQIVIFPVKMSMRTVGHPDRWADISAQLYSGNNYSQALVSLHFPCQDAPLSQSLELKFTRTGWSIVSRTILKIVFEFLA